MPSQRRPVPPSSAPATAAVRARSPRPPRVPLRPTDPRHPVATRPAARSGREARGAPRPPNRWWLLGAVVLAGAACHADREPAAPRRHEVTVDSLRRLAADDSTLWPIDSVIRMPVDSMIVDGLPTDTLPIGEPVATGAMRCAPALAPGEPGDLADLDALGDSVRTTALAFWPVGAPAAIGEHAALLALADSLGVAMQALGGPGAPVAVTARAPVVRALRDRAPGATIQLPVAGTTALCVVLPAGL